MLSRKTQGASKNENRYFRGVRTCSWNSLTFFHPIYSSLLACLKPPIRECRFIFRRIGRVDIFLRWSFSNSSTWATGTTLKENGRSPGGFCATLRNGERLGSTWLFCVSEMPILYNGDKDENYFCCVLFYLTKPSGSIKSLRNVRYRD